MFSTESRRVVTRSTFVYLNPKYSSKKNYRFLMPHARKKIPQPARTSTPKYVTYATTMM